MKETADLPTWFYNGSLLYFMPSCSLEFVYNIIKIKNGYYSFKYKQLAKLIRGPLISGEDILLAAEILKEYRSL